MAPWKDFRFIAIVDAIAGIVCLVRGQWLTAIVWFTTVCVAGCAAYCIKKMSDGLRLMDNLLISNFNHRNMDGKCTCAECANFECQSFSGMGERKVDGFVVGAVSEREELLRWRDPKKELPDEYTPILVRYGHIETRKAVVWLMVTPEGRRVWNVDNSDMAILDKDIIGWRPIIEL